jgi:hypothetical protein
LADLKEVPKVITKELIGVTCDGSKSVVLATITLDSADKIKETIDAVLAHIDQADGGRVIFGPSLIQTSEFCLFYVK